MAPVVRYRYVDFGTVFTGDPRSRGVNQAAESPATLFANELASDVGGTCWGANEPLAVIDHRASGAAPFPSASAAVLHKFNLIRERFTQPGVDVIWLVTHKEPDFDALCSLYLARWTIESRDAVGWQEYGLHPDGWLDLPGMPKIDWFNLLLEGVPKEDRWALLLAGYASLLDSRRRISCPPPRALHAILYAALKRGRDYLNESSGATEFFDEVRSCLQAEQLNPIIDSVLEGSTRFAPELAMLDREADAYQRDIQRARRSVVFLPEAEAPSAQFFKTPKEVLLREMEGKSQEVNAEDLLLADTFRIPTDGIYLRDPECLLFEEWAWLDIENSALGAGFEFTAIATSGGCPDGTVNQTEYVFSIAPDRARGRHLHTVWSRLQTREVEALRESQAAPAAYAGERASDQRTGVVDALLADPWVGGQSTLGTLVKTPKRGTLIGSPGGRPDLRDDPVAEEVRSELENAIYSAQSLGSEPQVTVTDFAASAALGNQAPHQFDLNAPLRIRPPQDGYFRFAAIPLRADVPVVSSGDLRRGLAEQIGETLWQVLHPEIPGSIPQDFAEHHLYVTPHSVGLWAERGIAIAQKRSSAATAVARDEAFSLQDEFASLISLVRDLDRTRADVLASATAAAPTKALLEGRPMEATVAQAERLLARALEVKHTLSLPDRDLLRQFSGAIGLDGVVAESHDLVQTAAENLRSQQLAEQALRAQEKSRVVANFRSKLRWLQVFAAGVLAVVIIDVASRYIALPSSAALLLALFAGPLVLAISAWILKPWRRKPATGKHEGTTSGLILAAAILAFIIAWAAGLLHTWSN